MLIKLNKRQTTLRVVQVELWQLMHKYNGLMVKIKQDDNYDREHPEKLFDQLPLNKEDEVALTGPILTKLKKEIAQRSHENADIFNLSFKMEHIKDVRVNYDYINELLAQLANQLHDGDEEGAKQTHEQLQSMSNTIEDKKFVAKLTNFIKGLFNKTIGAVNLSLIHI